MTYAFFGGCKIPQYLKQYEIATRAVLKKFDIPLVDMEFNCCGYPVRHQDETAAIFAAARNMALANRKGLPIMTPCQCCFGQLKLAAYRLKKDAMLRKTINTHLSAEGLTWDADLEICHLLSVLYHDIGPALIKTKRKKSLKGIKLAAHYGCHALRPGHITRFDNPLAPTIFEELITATGAESVQWHRRLECCGNPLWEKNNLLSLYLMKKKIESAVESGAQAICTACTYCQIQFDTVRPNEWNANTNIPQIPALLYIQILGSSLGLSDAELGWTGFSG